jgi:hypothetical protein
MRGIDLRRSLVVLHQLVTIPRSRPGNRHDCHRFLPGGVGRPLRATERVATAPGTRNTDGGSENHRWLDAGGPRRLLRRAIRALLTRSRCDLRVSSRRVSERLPECSGTERSVDPEDGGARRHRVPPANGKRRGADAGASLRRVPAPARRVLAGRREPEHRAAAGRKRERDAFGCEGTLDPGTGSTGRGVAHVRGDSERSAVLIGGCPAHQACALSRRMENVIRIQ